jgi:hypothetical protein
MGALSFLNALTMTEGVPALIYRTALDGINLAANVETFISGSRVKKIDEKTESLEDIKRAVLRSEIEAAKTAADLSSFGKALSEKRIRMDGNVLIEKPAKKDKKDKKKKNKDKDGKKQDNNSGNGSDNNKSESKNKKKNKKDANPDG